MDRQEIDRRGMLGSLLGGATLLGVGATGCNTQHAPQTPEALSKVAGRLDPTKANDILVSLDKRLAWIDKQVLPDDIAPLAELSKAKNFDEEFAKGSTLVRKTMRSLYLTGRFLDMPDEYKMHPGVQSRLIAAQKDMDAAVLGMTEMLEKATPEDFRRVQDTLRKDPLLGERIAKWIEEPAADDGMPFERRFATRASVLQLADRMRAQSPALVSDHIVSKVRRIEAQHHSEADQIRRLSARIGEEAFWKHQQHLASLHSGWQAKLSTDQGVVNGGNAYGPPPPASAIPEKDKPGAWALSTGGIMMGFGGGSVLLGIIFAGLATGESALFWAGIVLGVTVGPILLLIGLIFLIVGAVQRAAA